MDRKVRRQNVLGKAGVVKCEAMAQKEDHMCSMDSARQTSF